jgi:hypothetical protein
MNLPAIPGFALALVIALGGTQPANAQSATTRAARCSAVGDLHFVCGLINVEDFLPVDGGRWLVGSSYQEKSVGLYLIDTAAKTAKAVTLSIAAHSDAMYAGCAAPDLRALFTHGLDVVSGRGGTTIVYAVNHAGRNSVEVFHLNAAKASAEWIGCAVLPAGADGNAVAALHNGSFVVTKFVDPDDKDSLQKLITGTITGTVYRWTPGEGFSEVPGTRLSGDNGVAVSRDGKWLFVNATGANQIYRVALSGKGERSSVKVDFHPDNLRWAPDGKLFVTGSFTNAQNFHSLHGWAAVRLDPQTMTVTPVVKEPGYTEFDNATSTVQVGQTLWFGTYAGDRMAYRAMP